MAQIISQDTTWKSGKVITLTVNEVPKSQMSTLVQRS